MVECSDFRTESASGAVDNYSWYAIGSAIYPAAGLAPHTLWVEAADDMHRPCLCGDSHPCELSGTVDSFYRVKKSHRLMRPPSAPALCGRIGVVYCSRRKASLSDLSGLSHCILATSRHSIEDTHSTHSRGVATVTMDVRIDAIREVLRDLKALDVVPVVASTSLYVTPSAPGLVGV